jgi:dTDP-4-dehydrorhamnose 3,5-epimerase/reductase
MFNQWSFNMIDDNSVFIVGANGQLGLALKSQYPGARSADIGELDITDKESVEKFNWEGIKIILNAAAFTNVDGAESTEGRVASWKVNATAVGYLVKAALEHDMTIVHVSSDYVFDGTQDPHTEEEPLSPLGVYAQSKAAGDLIIGLAPKHYLLRTSWVIGEGKNFVRTMLGLGQKGIEPKVVSDQIGRLTFTSELVKAIDHLLSHSLPYGTYNVSNSGEPASWADITREIFKLAGYDLTVTDISTAAYYEGKEGIAPRPLKSTLSLDKIQATGFIPTDWHDDLENYVRKEVGA